MNFVDTDDELTIRTANDALGSKLSAARLGYYTDEFLELFMRNSHYCPRKPPIINRGYFARVECISYTIKKFLEEVHTKFPGAVPQILILGGGYDTKAIHLLRDCVEGSLHIFEVDFADVVESKARIITSNMKLLSALIPSSLSRELSRQNVESIKEDNEDGDADADCASTPAINPVESSIISNHATSKQISTCTSFPSFLSQSSFKIPSGYKFGNLTIQAIDIRHGDLLVEKLMSASFDISSPTLVITECVMLYMPQAEVLDVIGRLGKKLLHAAWVSYDMFNPNDAFGKMMLNNLRMAGHQGKRQSMSLVK